MNPLLLDIETRRRMGSASAPPRRSEHFDFIVAVSRPLSIVARRGQEEYFLVVEINGKGVEITVDGHW
jgi:hypothetical protein